MGGAVTAMVKRHGRLLPEARSPERTLVIAGLAMPGKGKRATM
jgi:hypothetical protein